MSQSFAPLVGTDTLTASRTIINNNFDALLTTNSGTAFPTVNIAVGMGCYRTDTQRVYRLQSTGPAVWVLVENLNPANNYSKFLYYATNGQTAFTGVDSKGITLNYTVGFVEVNVGGSWLTPDDYVATSGTSITINKPVPLGWPVYIQSLAPFNVADTMSLTQNGADILNKNTFRRNVNAAPKKNYVVNGGMQISLEYNGTAATGQALYAVEQFTTEISSGAAFSIQQVASLTPGGSPNRLRFTVTTADATIAAGEYGDIVTKIEGNRVADLRFGTASAKSFTVQFGVKAPAGTYCIIVLNNAVNRSYVAEYTISAGEANTEVVKSVTIPGDTTGTWAKDTTAGLWVRWSLAVGTTYQQAANAWGTGNTLGSSNQFNFFGTNGNVFELFDVGVYEGINPPEFVPNSYSFDLIECQRYWELIGMTVVTTAPPYANTSWYRVTKRISPTLGIGGNPQGATIGGLATTPVEGVRQLGVSTTPADISITANARM